jgi:hypothetical protein
LIEKQKGDLMMLGKFWQPFFSVLLITGLILTTDAPLGTQAARLQKSTTGIRIESDPDLWGVFKPIGSYTVLDSNFDKTTHNSTEDPVITLDPEAMSSFQARGEIVTKYLTIVNQGGADLDWSIYEDPLAWQPTLLPLRDASHVVSSPGRITIGSGALASAVNRDMDIVSNVHNAHMEPKLLVDQLSITHSLSQTIMAENSVACSEDGGESTAENGFLRTFFLEDFGIYGDFEISQVSFGIEALNDNSIDITVNLYTLDALEFTYANMTLIGSSSETIPPQALTIMSMPISATAPAGSTLVVEIDAPDMSDTAAFFIGSNDQGQTASSYIRSASCGMPQPTDFSTIGFPNVHIVINVTGEEPPVCDAPGSVDWIDVAPTSGTVAPDASQDVSVIFDSTGLELGSYSANLCLASNDPARNMAIVPLHLEVVESFAIDVTPISFEFVVSAGQQDHDTLTIHNVGAEDLSWSIDTKEIFTQAVIQSSFSEGFDNIDTLIPNGWFMQNNSQPLGVTDWFQGNPNVFPSHQGAAPDSYIGANFNNTAGVGTISNWMLTPEITMNNGDMVSFWTRRTKWDWEDRLQVRLSTNGASTNIGTDAMDVGDFTSLLLDINPEYAPGGYPTEWTEFVITISGLNEPTLGRIGFRYFVEDGGPTGDNSDYIGIDTFEYVSFTPCAAPGEVAWLSAEPGSGTTPAGESDDVTVTVDASGLAPNEMYEADLCVFSNDPVNPVVVIPVILTVEEEAGEAPVTGFIFEPSAPLVGEVIQFTNLTTGTEPIEYLWDFGDGATNTEENPTHIYTTGGLYTITLTATNDFGMDVYTAALPVTVISDTNRLFMPLLMRSQ